MGETPFRPWWWYSRSSAPARRAPTASRSCASTRRRPRSCEEAKAIADGPSILRYVILEQDGPAASVFARQGAAWTARALTEADVLAMPEIGVEVPLAEVYADLSAADSQP